MSIDEPILPRKKRKFKRYDVIDAAMLISNVNVGRLLNISAGGLSLRFIGETKIPTRWRAALISHDNKVQILNLPINVSWEGKIEIEDVSLVSTQKIGASFDNVTEKQQEMINTFIENYSVQN